VRVENCSRKMWRSVEGESRGRGRRRINLARKKKSDFVREIPAWVMLKYYTLRNMSVLQFSMTLASDKKRGIDEFCCRL
jgi:ribosomal protein L39E